MYYQIYNTDFCEFSINRSHIVDIIANLLICKRWLLSFFFISFTSYKPYNFSKVISLFLKKKTDPQILFCKYETSFLTCTTSKAINASNFVIFNFYLLLNILIYSNCFFFCYTINNKRKAAFTSSLLSFHYILFSISIRFEISLKIL